jgi:hypothetical protein
MDNPGAPIASAPSVTGSGVGMVNDAVGAGIIWAFGRTSDD